MKGTNTAMFPINACAAKRLEREKSALTMLENWKKLWNMKVTIIPIVIGAFGTVTKG